MTNKTIEEEIYDYVSGLIDGATTCFELKKSYKTKIHRLNISLDYYNDALLFRYLTGCSIQEKRGKFFIRLGKKNLEKILPHIKLLIKTSKFKDAGFVVKCREKTNLPYLSGLFTQTWNGGYRKHENHYRISPFIRGDQKILEIFSNYFELPLKNECLPIPIKDFLDFILAIYPFSFGKKQIYKFMIENGSQIDAEVLEQFKATIKKETAGKLLSSNREKRMLEYYEQLNSLKEKMSKLIGLEEAEKIVITQQINKSASQYNYISREIRRIKKEIKQLKHKLDRCRYRGNNNFRCAKCHKIKPQKSFYVNKVDKFGISTRCRSCMKPKLKKYYQTNKERIKKYTKQWRANNPEKVRSKARQKDKLITNLRRRLKDFLQQKVSIHSHKLFGCRPDELRLYIESLWAPEMSWENYGEWHIDHIIPLSRFKNLKDPTQMKLACHYKNLQPLWGADNLEKGNNLPDNISPNYLPHLKLDVV